jgi:ubiquinol-cytochrome c reductase iron-sulfur subunit
LANNEGEIKMAIEKYSDPGLPEHQHRLTDESERHAKRAERQVAILFLISALGTLLTIYSYIFVKTDTFVFIPVIGSTNAEQLMLGLGLTISLLFIGLGAVHWAKQLMPDNEVIAERHELRSEDSDRKELIAAAKAGAGAAGLGRRSLIKRSLGLALGLIGLTPLVLLRDLGQLPKKQLENTNWKAGTRLVLDPSNRPVKVSDLEVGSVAQILPELPEGQERTLENIATDAVLLIRIRPTEFNLSPERLSWTHEGIIAFSKICSHMGCAVALYEQQTKHLLCPCHQSTFDVTRAAKVIFGPAARPLPQLPITVDAQGYLVAQSPFREPIGPSFWERNSQ